MKRKLVFMLLGLMLVCGGCNAKQAQPTQTATEAVESSIQSEESLSSTSGVSTMDEDSLLSTSGVSTMDEDSISSTSGVSTTDEESPATDPDTNPEEDSTPCIFPYNDFVQGELDPAIRDEKYKEVFGNDNLVYMGDHTTYGFCTEDSFSIMTDSAGDQHRFSNPKRTYTFLKADYNRDEQYLTIGYSAYDMALCFEDLETIPDIYAEPLSRFVPGEGEEEVLYEYSRFRVEYDGEEDTELFGVVMDEWDIRSYSLGRGTLEEVKAMNPTYDFESESKCEFYDYNFEEGGPIFDIMTGEIYYE